MSISLYQSHSCHSYIPQLIQLFKRNLSIINNNHTHNKLFFANGQNLLDNSTSKYQNVNILSNNNNNNCNVHSKKYESTATTTPNLVNEEKFTNVVNIANVTKPLDNPIVLCHGLFGFDKRGPDSIPFLQIHYWNRIKELLEGIGCELLVAKVAPTGGVKYRATELKNLIEKHFPNRKVHLIAHSMGGLDCRYMITHMPSSKFKVLTLTTLSTPHRGSPFMDWCRKRFGVGWIQDPCHIPSLSTPILATAASSSSTSSNPAFNGSTMQFSQCESPDSNNGHSNGSSNRLSHNIVMTNENNFQSLGNNVQNTYSHNIYSSSSISPIINSYNSKVLSEVNTLKSSSFYNILCKVMSVFDHPAYRILTTDFCNNIFNPLTPDHPDVMYMSYGAYREIPYINPLCISQQIIKKSGQVENDGLVGVESAKWGMYKGTVQADHFDLNNRWLLNFGQQKFNVVEFYHNILQDLYRYE